MTFSAYGSSGKYMENDNKALTNEEAQQYLQELERDQDKEFEAEFIRTTNLEFFLIKEYGFEGLKLVFSKKNSENYYPLGEIPQDSPWSSLNEKEMRDVIDIVFKPVNQKMPKLISQMKERIRLIYVEKTNKEWKLHYLMDMKLYDGRDYFQVYTGGRPNKNVLPNAVLKKYNWSLPNDLVEFYSIHDGFGGSDSQFLLSSKELTVMGEMMNPIAKQQNVFPTQYKFDDLLEFFPDGSGNAQCFLRIGDSVDVTVDWDHEIWEISEGINFYDFLDERLSQLDEE